MKAKRLQELYAALVVEAQDFKAREGHKPSRYDMLWVLIDWKIDITREILLLVDHLHVDGFATE